MSEKITCQLCESKCPILDYCFCPSCWIAIKRDWKESYIKQERRRILEKFDELDCSRDPDTGQLWYLFGRWLDARASGEDDEEAGR